MKMNKLSKFNRFWILFIILAFIGMVTKSGEVSAQSGLHLIIDGSSSVYPVATTARYQFPAIYEGTTFDLFSSDSKHGQISILNGYVDVALSSIPCNPENQFMPDSGQFTTDIYVLTSNASPYACSQLEDTVIGQDGIAIIVNNARACSAIIRKEDILNIWQGGYPNPSDFMRVPNPVRVYTWKEMFPDCEGQPFENDPIRPIAPLIGSGVRFSLATMLGISPMLAGERWPAEEATIDFHNTPRKNSAAGILQEVRTNPNYIGYVPLAYLAGARPLALSCESFESPPGCIDTVAATRENVMNGIYPLGRNLRLLSLPQTINPRQVIQDYLSWMNSPRGQAVVLNAGYLPHITPETIPPNWDIVIDHSANIADVSVLSAYWNRIGPADPQDPIYPNVRGWVRADVNFDGRVNILDVSSFSSHWNQTW